MTKPQLVVAAAIIYRDDKILCARKALGKSLAGFWEFPGGKREAGESFEQCLRRELHEELNVESRIGEFFAKNVFEYDDKIIDLNAYWAEITGSIQLIDHDKIRWLARKDLQQLNWAPADIPFVKKIQQTDLPQRS